MRTLRLGLSLLTIGLATPAFGQDTDGDGASDAVDAYPCDAQLAAEAFAPAEGVHGMLLFEDQWPRVDDLDFNDVVVAYNYRFGLDAQGDVTSVHAAFDPLAVGGAFDNGFGLHLPIPVSAVQSVTLSVDGGAATPLTPSAADAELTVVLMDDLRDAFGGVTGPVNSVQGGATIAGQRLDLVVQLSTPAPVDIAAAPFDPYIFRTATPSHEIHGVPHAGTAAMDASLFGTADDGSGGGRYFVDAAGLPHLLVLPEGTPYPAERQPISALFPDVGAWAASGGAQNTDFYQSQVVGAVAYANPLVPTLPAAPVADRSCVPSGASQSAPGTTCKQILQAGGLTDGVYWIDPDGPGGLAAFQVWCDQTTDGGGWTVFQRRLTNTDFYRLWADYEAGFGPASGSYWMGLSRLHAFTSTYPSEARVDLGYGGASAYAKYSSFGVGAANTYYRLSAGGFSGTAGDALSYHSGARFSARDRDLDSYGASCAQRFLGAWWYLSCHYSNLNGQWGNTGYAAGPVWYHWQGYYRPMSFTQMAVRER